MSRRDINISVQNNFTSSVCSPVVAEKGGRGTDVKNYGIFIIHAIVSPSRILRSLNLSQNQANVAIFAKARTFS